MPTSVNSVADLINISLTRIGYKLRVSSLWDGSEAATVALDVYANARDDFLRDGNWDFARRDVVATLLRSAPPNYIDSPYDPATMPPQPWLYAYEYPGDCLKARIVRPQASFTFEPMPMPVNISVANVIDTVSRLASVAIDAAGTGYVPGDFIYPSGGTQTTQAVLQLASTKVVSATIAAAGTGGTPGTQTVTGTTGTGAKFTASVTVSGGGAITAVLSIVTGGVYTKNPTTLTAEPVTGASLTGAQLSVVMGCNAVTVVNPGVFTRTSTTFTQGSTSGSGTSATFNTATYTSASQSRRVIVSNSELALLTYTGQVTDLTQWPPDALDGLAAKLGRLLVPKLIGLNAIQPAAQDEAVQTASAMQEQV